MPADVSVSGRAVHQPKLLLVIGSLQAGGAERQLSQMANYWAADGAAVTVATWTGRSVDDFYRLDPGVSRVYLDGGAIRRTLAMQIRFHLARISRLRRLIKETRPDAVVSFVTESNVLTILASRGLKVRTIVSERTQPARHTTLGKSWQLLRRLFYFSADAVVAQTQDAALWLVRRCMARALVIPNALVLPEHALRQREQLIIAVGRLSTEKGFDLLLRAFAPLSTQFPGWRLAIIGQGPEREALGKLSEELGVQAAVQFVGQTSQISEWMARASLVVQPSRFEGFPNVVLESMGMGAAVISADCASGPAELIADGVNGRLVPVEDVTALSDAMSRLMADSTERERLGREALKVRQRFNQDRIMNLWDACVLGGDHERPASV